MENEKKTTKVLIAAIIAILIVIMAGAAAIIFVLQMDNTEGEDHLALANEYLDSEEYEDAISEYLMVLDEDSTNLEAYEGIATAYVELEQYDEALEILNEGLIYLEEDGDEDDIEELKELIEQIEGLAGGKTDSGQGTDSGSGQGTDSGSDSDSGSGTGADSGTAAEATDPAMNHQVLMDYYNDEMLKNTPELPFNQAFDEKCSFWRQYEGSPSHTVVSSGISGYINYIFYDFDLDGIDELVATRYSTSDEITIEVVDVDNGYPMQVFSLDGIRAGLCGIDDELMNDIGTIELGLCEKDGKVYITERGTYTLSVFSNHFRTEMLVYEVNGSMAERVFFEYVGGENESDMHNNSVMMDQYRNFPKKLTDIGFNSTANNLGYDLRFSAGENITPLVYGCARHCGTYERFDTKSLIEKGTGDAGRKSFVFAQTESEGESIMNSAH